MVAYTRNNALDQALDINGSLTQSAAKTLVDESAGLGGALAGQTGSAASITAVVGGIVTIDDCTGFTAASVGRFITITGADTTLNNGTFLITEYVDATSVKYSNVDGVAPDDNNGAIGWTERNPYSLEDDLNFVRTDRKNIKGTTNYYDAIPTYTRPTATGTNVPANLTNIASKTTDAKALTVNRVYRGVTVAASNTHKELVSVGNLKHADSTDTTGVPINDGYDAGAHSATYVEITDSADGSELVVKGGGDIGKRVFGRTRAGTTVAASGSITTVAKANLSDGETFTIGDGINTATVFEFDTGGGVTPGNVAVDISGATTADDVRDACISAINGVTTTLLVTASNGGSATVSLANDNVGAQGNVAITDTVSDLGFTHTGMSGGAGGYSPDSVDVEFRAVAIGADISTSVAYTWESGQPTLVDMAYGYRERLDNLSDTALRVTMSQGLATDADLRQDVEDIRDVIDTGLVDGATSLVGLLTNTGNYYCFVNLPDATPSVVEALNTLNTQIGNRTYTGTTIITSGQTITASLQALATAIEGVSIVRTIERLAVAVPAGTSHLLPGSISYTLDVSGNGKNMFVFWRGLLRDPGLVTGGNDYDETDTTHITPHSRINAGDHINYLVLA